MLDHYCLPKMASKRTLSMLPSCTKHLAATSRITTLPLRQSGLCSTTRSLSTFSKNDDTNLLLQLHKRHPMARLRQPKRHFTTTLVTRKDDSSASQSSSSQSTPTTQAPSRLYTFEEIQDLSTSPEAHRILIDVREPGELQSTGRIPGAQNLPISSAADGFFLPADEFEERFGFPKPDPAKDEAIFYCKAGVRSRAATALAQQAGFAAKVGEFPGSWLEWAEKGGQVQR